MLSERDSEERVKVSEHIVTETHAGQTAERAFSSQRPRSESGLVRRVSEQITRGREIRAGMERKGETKGDSIYSETCRSRDSRDKRGSGVQKQEESFQGLREG